MRGKACLSLAALFCVGGCIAVEQPSIVVLSDFSSRQAWSSASVLIVGPFVPDVIVGEQANALVAQGHALAIGAQNRDVALQASANLASLDDRMYAEQLGYILERRRFSRLLSPSEWLAMGPRGFSYSDEERRGIASGAGAVQGAIASNAALLAIISPLALRYTEHHLDAGIVGQPVGASAQEVRLGVALFDLLEENRYRRLGQIGRIFALMEGPIRINLDLDSDPPDAALFTPNGEFPRRTRTNVIMSKSGIESSWLQLADGRRCRVRDALLEGRVVGSAAPAAFRVRCRFLPR